MFLHINKPERTLTLHLNRCIVIQGSVQIIDTIVAMFQAVTCPDFFFSSHIQRISILNKRYTEKFGVVTQILVFYENLLVLSYGFRG